MAYAPREEQFHRTIESYERLYGDRDDWEVVVVGDTCEVPYIHSRIVSCSVPRPPERTNPGVLLNLAASMANGERLVITCPEVMHRGDVLAHADKAMATMTYICYPCLTLRKDGQVDSSFMNGWYQHPKHSNRLLHFCSVITRELFMSMGGFHLSFDLGHGHEDVYFALMAMYSKTMKIMTPDEPVVAHQWHPRHAPSKVKDGEDRNATRLQRALGLCFGRERPRAEEK
jgi:hypothetical protein